MNEVTKMAAYDSVSKFYCKATGRPRYYQWSHFYGNKLKMELSELLDTEVHVTGTHATNSVLFTFTAGAKSVVFNVSYANLLREGYMDEELTHAVSEALLA